MKGIAASFRRILGDLADRGGTPFVSLPFCRQKHIKLINTITITHIHVSHTHQRSSFGGTPSQELPLVAVEGAVERSEDARVICSVWPASMSFWSRWYL